MFSHSGSTRPRSRVGAVLFFLLLSLAAPAPARAAPAPARATAAAAAAPAPLASWTDGWKAPLSTRTGVIRLCVIVAAFALIILIKRLH